MAFYAVIAFDHSAHDMRRRDALRAAHRDFVQRRDEMIRLASAMQGKDGEQTGSVYIFEASSAADVEAWIADEPFCRGGVYRSIAVVEITPALNRLPPIDWPRR